MARASNPVWPELSNSCLFWNVLTHFGHFLRVYLMCGNVLNLLWHICDQIWRNFASLGGFYLSILRLYLVSGKVLNILWHILMLCHLEALEPSQFFSSSRQHFGEDFFCLWPTFIFLWHDLIHFLLFNFKRRERVRGRESAVLVTDISSQ